MQRPIYMDHNATTPVDERVVEAMLPYFTEHFGNASSRSHAYGWEAEEAVERAREQVASAIGAAEARGVVFTSGATESNNLALKGVAAAYSTKGKHIVTVATEHRAVLDPCKRLQREGFEVSVLPVDAGGLLDLTLLRDTIRDDTILVSVMAANNEIGTLQPIAEIGALTRERGVLFHCDAVQAVGKVAFDVEAANIDLASFSAHKMYGPKGVGALWIRPRRPRVRVAPEIEGGGQERGLRSGTLNVPGIVGFGQAAQLAAATWQEDAQRIGKLRRRLQDTLFDGIEGLRLNGADDPQRLPGNLNVAFPGTEGEALIGALRDVAVSSGSACSSTSVEPSHVLLALGLSKELAKSSLRFGLGRATTQEDVDFVARRVIEQIRRLRKHAPAGGLSGGALGL